MSQSQSPSQKLGFAGNVFALISGTAFVQAASVLASPFIARFYGPDSFGVLSLFDAIINIIKVIICMRYELAIVLPDQDTDAASLFCISVGFAILISLLCIPVIQLGDEPLLRWLDAPELRKYLWLIPLVVFTNGIAIALNYWGLRTKRFVHLSFADSLGALAALGTKLGLGYAGFTSAGSLIGANVLGVVTSIVVLGVSIWRDFNTTLQAGLGWQKMLAILKRFYKFPLYSTWSALLNTLSWQLPVMMLSSFFTPVVVGFYGFGNRVIRTPVIIIGNSLAKVFFQEATEAQAKGNLRFVVKSVFERLVSYGLFPMLLLMFIGKDLFGTVFGAEWVEAGVYMQILGVYMFFNFIAFPLGQLFSVLERQEAALITNVVLFLSRVGSLWAGGMTKNALYTLVLFSVSGVLVYGGYSMWIVRTAGVPLREWWSIVMRYALISGLLITVNWFVCFLFELSSWKLLGAYSAGAVLYYIWLVRSDEQMLRLLRYAGSSLLRRG